MKKNFIYIILISSMLFSCNRKIDVSQDLFHVNEFGGGDHPQGFIARSVSMDHDSSLIYIGDNGTSQVKAFNYLGHQKYTFGQKGRGPGEFLGTLLISSSDNYIIVNDISQQRVSVFTKSGNLLSSFLTDERHTNPLVSVNDSILIAGSSPVPFQTDMSQEKMFYKYDFQGNVISSFGSYSIQESNIPATFLRYQFEIYDGKLFVLYTYMPLFEVYDIEAEERIYSSDLSSYQQFENTNSELLKNFKRAQEKGLESVAGFLETFEKRNFFYKDVGDSLTITEFSFEIDTLLYVKTYTYPKKTNHRSILGAIQLIYNNSRKSFFIMEAVEDVGFVISEYKILS